MRARRNILGIIILLLLSFSWKAQNSIFLGIEQGPYYKTLEVPSGSYYNNLMTNSDLLNTKQGETTRKHFIYGINIGGKLTTKRKFYHKIEFSWIERNINEIHVWDVFYDTTVSNQIEKRISKEINYKQSISVLNYLFGSEINLKKFSLSGGLGISLQRIGESTYDYTLEFYYDYIAQPDYQSLETHNNTISGGYGVGLISQFQLDYNFSDHFSLGVRLNNYWSYLMFFKDESRHAKQNYTLDMSRPTPGLIFSYKF